ncbi:GNAT family N-acetyltransferase [Poseidonocella sedimentorum]|uniref:Protein N-acetyltransferase, RimJ/RimL family n=1 Tax=Poseidonocella sedimentorum TaxID=871652 RepID=A0A1I6DVX7_9RHOB|nr:GNAT family N-acetyltransferase [Poseidonocella sedimentorum]SFR09613.1 Protein N-acetyltransferase, RimJ/RimL family [Poseidonocella sedimentorum]
MTKALPVLETERLRLEPPSLAILDAEKRFWASDRATFAGGRMTGPQVWRYLALQRGHWDLLGYGMFSVVEKQSGAPVGLIGLWGPEPWPEPELAYNIYEGSSGKGYAEEAARAVMGWNFGALGRERLISVIHPDNLPSQRLAARLGGAPTGEQFTPNPDADPVDIWRYCAPEGRS